MPLTVQKRGGNGGYIWFIYSVLYILPVKKYPGAALPEEIQASAQVQFRDSLLVISNAEFRMSTCYRGTLKELVKSCAGVLQQVAQALVHPQAIHGALQHVERMKTSLFSPGIIRENP